MFTPSNKTNISGPWYWQVRFKTGEYNKVGVKALTLAEACAILGHPIENVRRFNFETGRDRKPMSDETRARLKVINDGRRSLRNNMGEK